MESDGAQETGLYPFLVPDHTTETEIEHIRTVEVRPGSLILSHTRSVPSLLPHTRKRKTMRIQIGRGYS
ncbi:hypothetical protein BOX30_08535 [Leptospirillum ferriphilum]|nr:hypothetical protein BOX30_08535 [Leptospirillum ferriphilum]